MIVGWLLSGDLIRMTEVPDPDPKSSARLIGKYLPLIKSALGVCVALATVWLMFQYNALSERANQVDRRQITLDKRTDILAMDNEFDLLDDTRRVGPTRLNEVDDLLSKLRPLRNRLEDLAVCITSETCISDARTLDFFCRRTTLYEETVRPWLRDIDRGDEVSTRTYEGLYPQCPDILDR